MIYIRNDSVDPYFNLALEEYVLHNFTDDDYLLLWQNDRTIVIGKHQNASEEVNIKRAEELGVRVVRRNTGGGAVYHDMGNLNFSYITDWIPDKNMNYDTFLKPVIRALERFGVHAHKEGRNDLVVDGRKISGNAQCMHRGRILHHGTLLICSELSLMPELLNVKTDKIESKGIKSVRSRVANINEVASEAVDFELLKDALLDSFFGRGGRSESFEICKALESGEPLDRTMCMGRSERVLTDTQIAEIEKLRKDKYETWDWNFGLSADYRFKNARRFPGGSVEVRLDVRNGVIERCKIFGDFLALISVAELESAVVGCMVDESELRGALDGFDIRRYYGITLDELLECFAE